MHASAYNRMKAAIEKYLPHFEKPTVVDLGSRMVNQQKLSHRQILSNFDCKYIGVDVVKGPNVDVVMDAPYSIPLENESVDFVVTGQVIEHIPYYWASFLELARILKPGGYIVCTAPSRGHIHSPPYDCWRFYPDGYKSIAAFCHLHLLESSINFPPSQAGKPHFDYAKIPNSEYWGDMLGVFQKTDFYKEAEIAPFRKTILEWANKVADVHGINEKSAPAGNGQFLGAPIKHSKLDVMIPYVEGIISPTVRKALVQGYYETKEANFCLKYIPKKSRILELGGGLGFISTVVQKLNPEAYTLIEADSRLIPVIRETHQLNGVKDVLIHNCVVTSDPKQLAEGSIQMQLGNEFWGSSVVAEKKGSGKFTKVDTVALSTYLNNLKPNVLVIDIEGGEVDLFEDVDLKSVDVIIMEVHPPLIGAEGVDKIVAQLAKQKLVVVDKNEKETVLIFKRK